MDKKALKGTALAAIGGSIMFFGGCLDSGMVQKFLYVSAVDQIWEFVLDNDAVFDLWEGGDVPVAE